MSATSIIKGLDSGEKNDSAASGVSVKPISQHTAASHIQKINKSLEEKNSKGSAPKKAEAQGSAKMKPAVPPAKNPAVRQENTKQSTAAGSGKKPQVSVKINTSVNQTFAQKAKQYRFLFEELTKRDFKKKYKRTFLGMLWSVVSPFLTFTIQYFVFSYLFKRGDAEYMMYILTGTLMFHFFSDGTTTGMFSIYQNAAVLSKIRVPKPIFVLSSNVASIFNFLLTLVVYFAFMIFCGVQFGPHLLLLIYPIICLIIFNLGISFILSSLFVFFRDIQYLYSICTMLLMYLSAIFYSIDSFPEKLRLIFNCNPIYNYVSYARELVINATVPSLTLHLICFGFSAAALLIGYWVHKKTENKFVYYY